jgi:hypothetical protein
MPSLLNTSGLSSALSISDWSHCGACIVPHSAEQLEPWTRFDATGFTGRTGVTQGILDTRTHSSCGDNSAPMVDRTGMRGVTSI